jgi:hypothetical protein
MFLLITLHAPWDSTELLMEGQLFAEIAQSATFALFLIYFH